MPRRWRPASSASHRCGRMTAVPDNTPDGRTPRPIAGAHVDALVALDPVLATSLGAPEGRDRWPDWSPDGAAAVADLRRRTLAELDAAEPTAGGRDSLDVAERRCARLLRERLEAQLATSDAGEDLRDLTTMFSPPQEVRQVFNLMPKATDEDWQVVAARLGRVPEALSTYRRSLADGRDRGIVAGPRQVQAVLAQLEAWGEGGGWFSRFAAGGPEGLSDELRAAGAGADAAVAGLRDWLAAEYAPAASRRRDPVGREAYTR